MKNKLKAALFIILGLGVLICGILVKKQNEVAGIVIIAFGIFFLLLAVTSIAACFKNKDEPKGEFVEEKIPPEYRRKKTVLSRSEWEFLQILKGILSPDKYDIDIQVPLVAVIDKLTQTSYRNELFRVADFLIVDCVTYSPLLLIELNDASHERADRAERDRKVNEICERAGMPIVTFSQQEARDPNFIKKTISKNILRK